MATSPEDFGRQLIRETIGQPMPVGPVRRFDFTDLIALRDRAIRRYVNFPSHIRLDSMIVDLDESDKRSLAYLEAAVEVMNSLGLVFRTRLDATMPRPYTASQEVNDEETVGHNFTSQKR